MTAAWLAGAPSAALDRPGFVVWMLLIVVVSVPVGTLVYDSERGNLMRDLDAPGDSTRGPRRRPGPWGPPITPSASGCFCLRARGSRRCATPWSRREARPPRARSSAFRPAARACSGRSPPGPGERIPARPPRPGRPPATPAPAATATSRSGWPARSTTETTTSPASSSPTTGGGPSPGTQRACMTAWSAGRATSRAGSLPWLDTAWGGSSPGLTWLAIPRMLSSGSSTLSCTARPTLGRLALWPT